jgi:subtilisin family serine protease
MRRPLTLVIAAALTLVGTLGAPLSGKGSRGNDTGLVTAHNILVNNLPVKMRGASQFFLTSDTSPPPAPYVSALRSGRIAADTHSESERVSLAIHTIPHRTEAITQPEVNFVPDEVLVRFKSTVTQGDIDQLISACQTVTKLDTTTIINAAESSPNAHQSLPPAISSQARNIYWLRISLPGHTVEQTVVCFQNRPDLVEFAQPNFVETAAGHEADRYPNDPQFLAGSQWSLLNAGQNDPTGLPGRIDADIDVLEAWDLTRGDCGGVIVAVFDTGTEFAPPHPDLVRNLWTNVNEIPGDGIDNDRNAFVDDVHGFDSTEAAMRISPPAVIDTGGDGPEDTAFSGHGTHVAGIIGADGDNAQNPRDITGICRKAQLMIVRVGDPNSNDGRFVFSVLYVVLEKLLFQQKIRVINYSYGNIPLQTDPALKSAYDLTNAAGILFVKAAGNNSRDLDLDGDGNGVPDNLEYPCNSSERTPNVVCVGASNNADTLSRFSNYGASSVDLAAPGENILSLFLNGGVQVESGTSMAAPHVAGIAALAFSLFPGKMTADVKNDILFGAIGPQPSSGVDRIKITDRDAIFDRVLSGGRLRWPYAGDLGDAPASYDTVASPGGGALHWDIGNEFLGLDVTPEVDANTGPPLDQDPTSNIDPLANEDLADEPLGPGNGGFGLTPRPPWAPGAIVGVTYTVCSDYFGVADADGGRYVGGNPDRSIFVNGWFDLNGDGRFGPDELLVRDVISADPTPGLPVAPGYPNANNNFHPVLPPPTAPVVFPPQRSCHTIGSSFVVPPPGAVNPPYDPPARPPWSRFRLDYGEDIGLNDPGPEFLRDRNLPVVGQRQWARFGEVEDFSCLSTCVAPPDGCRTYVCDPATSACLDLPKPDGARCYDGSLCTENDTCQAGVCIGGNPVECVPPDACHYAGTCNAASGTCEIPPPRPYCIDSIPTISSFGQVVLLLLLGGLGAWYCRQRE